MSRRITPHDIQRYDQMKYLVILGLMLLMIFLLVAREVAGPKPDPHEVSMLSDWVISSWLV